MNINFRSAAITALTSAALFSVCLADCSPASAQQPTAASPAAVQTKAAKVKVFQVHSRETFLAKYGADKVRQLRIDEPNPLILRLSTDAPIKDLRILNLTFKGINDKGKISFDEKERTFVHEVNPEDIILIDMVIYGDIPNNGISYTDADGTVKRFSVNLSGEDGSPHLLKY